MKRHPRLRVISIAAGIALIVVSTFWPKESAIGTILLLYVTFEYLLAARDNLELTQEHINLSERQIRRQERVELHFDLACLDTGLVLRVSNLGLSNFLLQKVQVRRSDENRFEYDVHRVVQSGQTEIILLSRDLYEGLVFGGDIEFSLSYIGLDGAGKTSPKCFNLFLGMETSPVEVAEHLDAINWIAQCPKCNVPAPPNLHGLKTFDDASARRSQLVEDLAASCPNHQSAFLLTDEALRDHHRQRENRRRL